MSSVTVTASANSVMPTRSRRSRQILCFVNVLNVSPTDAGPLTVPSPNASSRVPFLQPTSHSDLPRLNGSIVTGLLRNSKKLVARRAIGRRGQRSLPPGS